MQTRPKLTVPHILLRAAPRTPLAHRLRQPPRAVLHSLSSASQYAGALRTTYAREAKYGLNRDVYYKPQERWGRLPVGVYSGAHLQLPPVPASSSMLAPLDGTTTEHKVGAKNLREADLVFEFLKALRCTDQTLIDIPNVMRKPGCKALSDQSKAKRSHATR